MKQLLCLIRTMSRCIVMLEDVNFIGDASDGQQQHRLISVVGNVGFTKGFTKTCTQGVKYFAIHRVNSWKQEHVVNCCNEICVIHKVV